MHVKLAKGIGFLGIFSVATGAMISSGIFILPGLAYAEAGPAVIVSYFAAGVFALLGVLSVIELSTAMPKAGGDYYYINRTFGPLLGTMSGVFGWIAMTLKTAFAVFGIAEVLFLAFEIPVVLSAAGLSLVFLLLGLAGVKQAAAFQIVFVAGLLGILVTFVVAGVPEVDLARFSPFGGAGLNTVIVTSGFIFVSFGGLLKAAAVSEEVINPKRNIPLGMISSIVLVTILYSLVVFVLTGTMEPGEFSQSLTPVADSARLVLGRPGYLAVTIASLLAFLTTANAGLMSASRYPVALARDNLVPSVLAQVSTKRRVPVLSLVLTSAVIFLSQLLPLALLVKAASTVILTSYVLTNLSVVVLRESRLSNYKPSFRAPLYPWLQIVCVGVFGFYIIDLGAEAIELSLAVLFACFCLYVFYGRRKSRSVYALLHLLRRITDKRLTEDLLEDELRDILISRDEIEQDHFDVMVHDAPVVDIEGPLDYQQLLTAVAEDIAQLADMDEESVIERFTARQQESNTAVSGFLAIPHIVLESGAKGFMYIVRCKKGVHMTEEQPNVKAVFLLGGSVDTRGLHLKTIASLATMVGQPGFEDEWLAVDGAVGLRNLMMLNRRRRFF